jgi:hypothetical protein
MAIFDVSLYEPISAVITADTTAYTADNAIWPTADGGLLEGATDQLDAIVIAAAAAILEPAAATESTNATLVTIVDTIETADAADILDADVIAISEAIIVETADAADVLDAEIISVPVVVGVGGGRPQPRPLPVEGFGYGVLPELEGEAFGAVIIIGEGVGALAELDGEAAGSVGVAGRSTGQFTVHAAAIGNSGQAGAATAVLNDLSVASDGAVGVRGSGSGAIVKLKGAAIGRHDDDDAAVMTFLLAA